MLKFTTRNIVKFSFNYNISKYKIALTGENTGTLLIKGNM